MTKPYCTGAVYHVKGQALQGWTLHLMEYNVSILVHALPIFVARHTDDPAEAGSTPPGAPARAHRPDHLIDSHGRIIRDLRLSVTDRCNFRCVYCMDPAFRYMPKQQLLSLEEYLT